MTPIAPTVFSTTDPKTIGQRDESATQTWAANSFVSLVTSAGISTYTVVPSAAAALTLGIAGLAPQAAYGSANTPRPPTQLWGKTHDPISPRNTVFAINICSGATLTTTLAATAALIPGAKFGLILQSNGAGTTVHMLDVARTGDALLEFVGIHPDANVLGASEPGTRVLVRVAEPYIQSI